MGRERYANTHSLTITADGGGSNGARVRLWKVELQKLVDETGLCIFVLHLPPGTSKWNNIEHRLFSVISKNWRGRPLTDYRTIVELIGATTSTTGLTVRCQLDENLYPAGINVSDQEMAALNILRNDFHGEWNYAINPRLPKSRAVIYRRCLRPVNWIIPDRSDPILDKPEDDYDYQCWRYSSDQQAERVDCLVLEMPPEN